MWKSWISAEGDMNSFIFKSLKVSAKVEFPVVMERDEKQYHTFFEGGKIQEARKPWHRG